MVSQGIGGHEGMSGTPLWKIQQQNQAAREAALQESLAYAALRAKPIVPSNVLVEAVSVGAPGGKPLARHVLIKCLRKVAQASKVEFPTTGVFDNQAPIALFALFDGQSSAGTPGPMAAEFCARNIHKKVMENLASLPPNCTSETFVKATLVKSFEDLDSDLIEFNMGDKDSLADGCGAAVALLIGDYLFTAALGLCDAVLVEAGDAKEGSAQGTSLGRAQGRPHSNEERARVLRAGGTVVGEGASARVRSAAGVSEVSRSLGNPIWKVGNAANPVVSSVPEIHSVKLSWSEKHLFLLLAAKPVAQVLEPEEMVTIAMGFKGQPRAACGEIANTAAEKLADASQQCTAVKVWLLPGGPFGQAEEDGAAGGKEGEAPPKKKAKPTPGQDVKSSRLRHILVRFQDPTRPAPVDAAGRKVVLKTRQDAETLLRRILRELNVEMEAMRKKPGAPRKPEDLALKSEKFLPLCKEHSACPTAQKGGGMCGDLGWVSREAQRKLSAEFQTAVSALRPGMLSDIVVSCEGLHIVQRIA